MSKALRVIPLSCLLVLLLLPPVGATRTDAYYEGLAAARATFFQAVDGDKRAVRTALQQFRRLKDQYPDNPLVNAYIGACETLQGRDGSNVTAKRTSTEQGIRDLDAALVTLPLLTLDNAPFILEAKLVIANAYIHIPSFFNRRQEGERLLRELLDDPALGAMPPGFQASVLVTAATVAQLNERPSDSVSLLKRAQELDPGGREGRRAQQLLAGGDR